ncbi:MAG: hypothetical protein U0791_24265 [Gemmataceae bacterium]
MSIEDAILITTLAAEDAARLPIRHWEGGLSAARCEAARLPGAPLRMSSLTRSDGGRKSGERTLEDLAARGLVRVTRSKSLKFPLVALIPLGDARARALAGLPGLDLGHLFLTALVEYSPLYLESISGRWVPEIDFNLGGGWGESTREERRGLGQVELDALPAIAAGWAKAHSSIRGNAAYAATPAGFEAAARPAPAASPVPPAKGGAELYRRAQDERLAEFARAPIAKEIGELPLVHCDLASRRYPAK